MDPVILHCDCNGFYASVECIFHPELKNVPMAVCGNPESRHGIILAKNEIAKKYGVQTAETVWQAKRKCPDLVLTAPRHGEYYRYSKLVNEIYHRYTDYIEPFGIDESWLDVTNGHRLFGDGKTIADRLRKEVREELGLTISVGVSFNKVFAKLGSDYKKPDATTVIDRENFRKIVFPLPVRDMLYVGRSAAQTLKNIGVETIGQLAQTDPVILAKLLGKTGEMLYRYANGLDDSPVEHVDSQREIKSVGNGMTFVRDLLGENDIRTAVIALSDTVSSRMRKYGVKCGAVQIQVKSPDFHVISRQKTLTNPTNLASVLQSTALDLIFASWNLKRPIRALTITGASLFDAAEAGHQTSLFEQADLYERQEKMESAVDRLRERFGRDIIGYGSTFQNDIGVHDPAQAGALSEEEEE